MVHCSRRVKAVLGVVACGGGGDTHQIRVRGVFGTVEQVTDAVSAGIVKTAGVKITKR